MRVFLLALAIIDDVIAVLIIALFYSGGLQFNGIMIASFGILMVLGFQRIGVGSALAYILPGAVVWLGFLMTGSHPTLAGVALGLMTPVRPIPMREPPLEMMSRVAEELRSNDAVSTKDTVAYGVMPLFALANAGISPAGAGVDVFAGGTQPIMLGVGLALVAGKPIGVVGGAGRPDALRFGPTAVAPE